MPGPRSSSLDPLPLLLALLAGFFSACAATPLAQPEPLPALASESFARARQARARGGAENDPELLRTLAEARAVDPGWVAPRRFEDDLLIAEHRQVEALARRRAELADAPDDAALCYLAARLEGTTDAAPFQRATRLDPALAWGWHGLAWTMSSRREHAAAIASEERAVALAREPWERSFFTMALARQLRSARRVEEALELLHEALAELELDEADRAAFACDVALFELELMNGDASRRGYLRGLELIREDRVTDRDLRRLMERMPMSLSFADPTGLELELALAAHPGPQRERLRARRWLSRSSTPMGRMLLERAVERGGVESIHDELSFRGAFRAGWYAEAIREWVAGLPGQVLAGDGRPANARLARVVRAAHELEERGESRDTLDHLGAALIEAGWFYEAQRIADALAAHDLDRALELREQAAAGRVLFGALSPTLIDVEKGREDVLASVSAGPPASAGSDSSSTADPQGVDEVLRRWAPHFATAGRWLGGPTDVEEVAGYLLASPRVEYGFVASVIHPGYRFSAAEEAAGLGVAGDPVPGLAALMARYGRFAILGEVLGAGGPDGTVLRLLHLEEAEGEHLGVPWKGTIAWCEGTDVDSRAARQGARIAGAALHEGYWIDLTSARFDLNRWNALADEYAGEEGVRRVDRALATRGLPLRTPPAHEERRREERTAPSPSLGEAARVRLAVMRSRRAPGEILGRLTLTELAGLVAVHEQGHLCDRTRFLPLGEKWGSVFALLARCGFSPAAVQARLEYRAQLTALCEVEDPRLPLVEILDTMDAEQLGGLPHAMAYRGLLGDLLQVLDRELEREPGKWTRLDPGRTLVHQLHWLEPEEVRGLARKVARKEGLF